MSDTPEAEWKAIPKRDAVHVDMRELAPLSSCASFTVIAVASTPDTMKVLVELSFSPRLLQEWQSAMCSTAPIDWIEALRAYASHKPKPKE